VVTTAGRDSVSVETIGSSSAAVLPRCTPSNTFKASYCERRSAAAPVHHWSAVRTQCLYQQSLDAFGGRGHDSTCFPSRTGAQDPSRPPSSVPHTVGYKCVKIFDTPWCRNTSCVITNSINRADTTSLPSQSSAFRPARIASRSRYTLSVQPLFDVCPRFVVCLFMKTFHIQKLLVDSICGAVVFGAI